MATLVRKSAQFDIGVTFEDGWFYGEVLDLPGCFASGQTPDELLDAFSEAIPFYLDDNAIAFEVSRPPELISKIDATRAQPGVELVLSMAA